MGRGASSGEGLGGFRRGSPDGYIQQTGLEDACVVELSARKGEPSSFDGQALWSGRPRVFRVGGGRGGSVRRQEERDAGKERKDGHVFLAANPWAEGACPPARLYACVRTMTDTDSCKRPGPRRASEREAGLESGTLSSVLTYMHGQAIAGPFSQPGPKRAALHDSQVSKDIHRHPHMHIHTSHERSHGAAAAAGGGARRRRGSAIKRSTFCGSMTAGCHERCKQPISACQIPPPCPVRMHIQYPASRVAQSVAQKTRVRASYEWRTARVDNLASHGCRSAAQSASLTAPLAICHSLFVGDAMLHRAWPSHPRCHETPATSQLVSLPSDLQATARPIRNTRLRQARAHGQLRGPGPPHIQQHQISSFALPVLPCPRACTTAIRTYILTALPALHRRGCLLVSHLLASRAGRGLGAIRAST
ncbi:hypothetical protein CC78DRAFT_618979 [Lojkania enalia]|uniref:Uncharacterized protein n=1 Tax=Lojkania enalia TaxID=147567 RepID=A0A9P4K3Q0_9PLEO|nr:hypothetical protein CC78DRAFT_618979 [Didymosphaeria enalia]